MSRGVLVGCDQTQEWMLRWWWSHYIENNSYPVAFVDWGMSSKAFSWCKDKGHGITLDAPKNFVFPQSLISSERLLAWEKEKEVWSHREACFYKPFALQQTPFDETIWIDLDREVIGSLTPIFSKIHLHSKIALVKELDEKYNAGVIAYHRDSPLLPTWSDLCFHQNDHFLNDQEVLSFIINNENIEVTELPNKYNWVVRDGINCEAVILHWSGKWGKEIIRRQTLEIY